MGDTLNILISEPIEQPLLERLTNVVEVAKLTRANPVYNNVVFSISSIGGSVVVGKDIYKLIKSILVPTTMINVGHVASIAASAVFVAAKHRHCYSNSTFMIHPTHLSLRSVLLAAGYGAALAHKTVDIDTWRINDFNLQEASLSLGLHKTDSETLALLAKETGTEEAIFRTIMETNKTYGCETKMTAYEALNLNIVDLVIDAC